MPHSPACPLPHWPKLLAFAAGWFAAVAAALAQTAGTGSVQGRVYNPGAQEYVRNAEVRLEGTNQVTYTESDGSFQFGQEIGRASCRERV